MRGRLRRSLEARVYGVTILVLVTSLGVYGTLQARTAVREHQTLVVEGVRASLANLAESVARRLIIEDFAGMDEALVRAARFPGVLRIQVCNVEGVVLSEVRRDGDRARSSVVPDPARLVVPAAGGGRDGLGERDDDPTLVLWEAVKVGPEAIGYVRETYDVSPLRASVRAIRERAVLVITGAVLVGLALLFRALRAPLGAIRRLAEYARDLDVHKGEQIAIPLGTVEVRQLGEALNHASAALARSERRLLEEGEAKRALQSRLLEAQKMEALGLMAGCIAHDFNNLLTVITASARMAADGAIPDGARDDLQHILNAADRGTALTRSLLAFGRRQPLAITAVDVNAVVRGLEGLLRKMAGSAVELRISPSPQPVRVMADPDQLEQVLVNLVTNARDAMRGGGVLTVAAGRAPDPRRADGGAAGAEAGWIAVSDTGVGMADDVKARIFEPFFTTKPRGSGTGLGMAIVHGIVSQHGGRIEVESRVGAGTTFRVVLPLATTAAAAAHPVAVARLGCEERRPAAPSRACRPS
jgi:signal transduction histidine kinase